ncbi:MAG TPA: hypothetical protein ENJ09_12650 [Planctomycetes bacterium]|nr:hypothetical protein [Planctomycetota bacterium]
MASASPLDGADLEDARTHIRDVLTLAFEHRAQDPALVVGDGRCALSRLLAEAYRQCLPDARFLDFDEAGEDAVRSSFEELRAGSLVVLIQSTSFRLDAFRIRVELFRRSLKVIEHPHLARIRESEARTYVSALAYDPGYFRGVGTALKERVDRARSATLHSGGAPLVFPAGLEPAKLNVGDYRAMRNVGGQFPIGEVFTESRDLAAVQGTVRIHAFGDSDFQVRFAPEPFPLVIEDGRVTRAPGAPAAFERVLADIHRDEGQVWVRELGLGLNRALGMRTPVTDIGTFERMCGVHLSLGAKHPSYRKREIDRKRARHHVDVFPATDTLLLDDEVVFEEGAWTLETAPWPPGGRIPSPP